MQFGADFDALIRRFSPDPDRPIALAVSGGSDSLALLSLTEEWAARGGRSLLVLTVDHALRPDAKTEAEHVADLCKTRGHRHETLTWPNPRASQNAARQARYELLCQAVRRRGADLLLLGHTLDDVVETALIRRRRGVRDARAAGPVLAAPAPVWPSGRGITLLRPLVNERRADLQDHLKAKAWTWADDPSNQDVRFERARVRRFLVRHPALAALALAAVQELQTARREADLRLAQALERVVVHADGAIDTGTADLFAPLLMTLARCASGSDRNPRANAVAALLRDTTHPGQRQTLGGAWFQKTQTGFLIGRDPAEGPAQPDQGVFDGRFVHCDGGAPLDPADASFLVRHALPTEGYWREVISERLAHLVLCYQTPRLKPVQT